MYWRLFCGMLQNGRAYWDRSIVCHDNRDIAMWNVKAEDLILIRHVSWRRKPVSVTVRCASNTFSKNNVFVAETGNDETLTWLGTTTNEDSSPSIVHGIPVL